MSHPVHINVVLNVQKIVISPNLNVSSGGVTAIYFAWAAGIVNAFQRGHADTGT